MLIAVPTKNRTAAFRRCLESLKRNAEMYNREIEFLVVDDSDNGSNAANRAVLEALGVPFRYYHRGDVAAYAAYLSQRTGCSRDLIRFLFEKHPSAHGAVRNFLMLMAAGQPVVMVDDDMICKFANVPLDETVEYQLTPRVVYPTPKIVDIVNEWDLIDDDFIGKHEAMLERVPLSIGGSIGDSGVTHSYVFFRSPELMSQIVEHPDAMLAMLHKRQLLRSVKRPTVVNWSCCVGMSFALDTTSILPPFFPVGRSEDVLFGGMLQNCLGKKAGYCTYSMWHTPVRPDTQEGIFTLGNTTPPEFMYKLLAECNPESFLMFGETLLSICNGDLHWIEEKHRKRYIDVMEFAYQGLQLPELLIQEIDRVKDVILNAPHYDIPYDLIKKYGELLLVWPKIYEVAKDYGKQQLSVRLHASTV